MIFLAGEPGVGKTRLAQEATMVSRNRGFLIAAGSGYEARQSTAFYPFLEALTTIYAQCPAAVRARVPREWPYLATLLPNENLTAPHVSGNQEDQERLFFAVTGFLHAVARETPVALLLDDLHWGDESSLQLLHYIAHHTRSHRVLIVGTYRDVEINRKHPLETTLRELSRQGLFERILVRRLAIEGTAALAAATIGEKEISDEFATILYRSTEGNPYFVQQVLRVLVERGAVFQADGTWDRKGLTEIEVPESVRSVIGQRLSRLSDTTQEILREASVLGQTFLFDDLLQLHGREEEDIESALEEAQVAGLVRETGRAGYGFDHALTQQSLYGELPSRRKRRLHVAAADVLDHLPGRQREKRIAELAWHLVEADESERALPYLLAAGDAAEAVFAHRDAEGHYRMALEMAEEAEDAAREADAVEKLGGVLVRVARLDEALEVLERAVSLRRNLVDIDGEYRATALIGRAHLVKGAAAEGIARLEPLATTALAVPADVRSRGTAALHSVLARLCWIDSQFEQSVFWAYEAANVARDLGDEEILAEAEVRRGTALSFLGRSEEALRVQEDALVLAERAGNPNHLHMALTNLGSTYMFYGDCGRQAEMRKRALAVVEQGGDVDSHLHALCGYALVLIIVGDWELARAHIERGMIMAQQLPNSWSASYALLSAGWLAAEQGKWTEARDLFDKLELIAQKTEDMQLLALMQEPLHELDLADGRPEACLKRILRILDSSRAGDMTETIVHHPLGETYLALGENEQALRLAEAAIELQSRRRYRFFLAPALRMKGEVLARRESWDEAEALFRESASLYHAMPQPYQEGITLYRWGHMLAARGNFIGARERLEAALATFTRLGANAYIQRTMDARAGLLDT